METKKIHAALADITAEQDPTLKSAKLASLCTRFGWSMESNWLWSAVRPLRF
jgi:hypothetical protein